MTERRMASTETGTDGKPGPFNKAGATRIALVNGIMLAGAAHAQEGAGAAASGTNSVPTQLPEVVVREQQAPDYKPEMLSSPKYSEPLLDVPQTVTVVPQAVIQEQGAVTLRDVLRNITGISMQAGEGGGGLPGDNLSIRGFNARSDIFVDGVRDSGAYSRDTFNTEQVEVTKGPASSTIGRGSAGGSINLVSKRPFLNPSYDATLGFGTSDYKRFTFDLNQPLTGNPAGDIKGTALRLNGVWHDADTPGRDVVKEERWGIAPTIGFGLGTPTRVFLSYLHMEQDNVPEYGLPWVPANTNAVLAPYSNKAPPVSFDNFYGLKDYDFEDVRNDLVTAIFEHDFSDTLRLRNLSRYGDTHRNSAITAPRFTNVNADDSSINRQLQRRQIDNQIAGNQTDVRFEFETGPLSHALIGGFEFLWEQQDNQNSAQTTNQPIANLYHPNPGQLPFGPMPPITGVPNDARAVTLAPYVFDTLKLGRHWELSGGLRFDHLDTKYTSGTNELSRTDDLLSWQAGLVYKPLPYGSIYFGAGTSFNPSIEGATGLALAPNNVNLEPEELFSLELGTKWDLFKERLSVTAAIFRTEKTNARTTGVNPGDPPLVLDGKQVIQGFEIGLAGNLTKEWSVFGGYTYLHSEVEDSNVPGEVGAEFGNTPEHSISLWTTYRFPWNVEIGGGAQYVGSRFNNLSSSAAVREAPDYWLFDAMVSYYASRYLTLRLNVYNIGDERYIDRVGGGHFIPGAGRSAVLTASLNF